MTARVPPARSVQLAAVVAALVLGVWTVAASNDRAGPGQIALDLVVGWLFVGSGAVVWRRRATDRVGMLMIATGIAWFAGGLLHRGPLVHLLMAFPTGRLTSRLAMGVVVFAYAEGVIGSFISLDAATVALAIAVVAAALQHVLGSSGPVRRGRAGAGLATLAFAMVLASGPVATFAGSGAREIRLLAYETVLAAIAIGLVADLMWGGWSRAAVTGLVVELGSRAEAGTLRDRLARALGDPSLVVGYSIPGSQGYVDEAGRAIELPTPQSGRVMTPIDHAGGPLAILVHDAAVLGDPVLVESVAAAARVAVTNVRLQAEIGERVTELEASRRRIVQAADVQRRRLERELSAGAMARMTHVGELLERIRSGADPTVEGEVTAAIAELGAAEEELRRFARGVYPAVLAEGGLAAAVAELASRSSAHVIVRVSVDRLPAAIETTAYFVCSEALANVAKHAHASRVEIVATVTGGRLVLVVTDDGVGGADQTGSGIRGLGSRVQALGGRLRLVSPPGRGTRLEVELPIR